MWLCSPTVYLQCFELQHLSSGRALYLNRLYSGTICCSFSHWPYQSDCKAFLILTLSQLKECGLPLFTSFFILNRVLRSHPQVFSCNFLRTHLNSCSQGRDRQTLQTAQANSTIDTTPFELFHKSSTMIDDCNIHLDLDSDRPSAIMFTCDVTVPFP